MLTSKRADLSSSFRALDPVIVAVILFHSSSLPVYKSTRQPIIGQQQVNREVGNPFGHFAVSVFKTCPNNGTRTIVGHEIQCKLTDRRRCSPLVQGGLGVPCCLTLSGKKKLVLEVEVLITNINLNCILYLNF